MLIRLIGTPQETAAAVQHLARVIRIVQGLW